MNYTIPLGELLFAGYVFIIYTISGVKNTNRAPTSLLAEFFFFVTSRGNFWSDWKRPNLVKAYIFHIVVFQLLILSQSALFGILLNNLGLLQYNNGYIQHAQRFTGLRNKTPYWSIKHVTKAQSYIKKTTRMPNMGLSHFLFICFSYV